MATPAEAVQFKEDFVSLGKKIYLFRVLL